MISGTDDKIKLALPPEINDLIYLKTNFLTAFVHGASDYVLKKLLNKEIDLFKNLKFEESIHHIYKYFERHEHNFLESTLNQILIRYFNIDSIDDIKQISNLLSIDQLNVYAQMMGGLSYAS